MHNSHIDLFFPTIAEREVQYNARESVPDFDACVRRYAESSARVRTRRPGVLDLHYGMGQDERLDLFLPAASQAPAPLFVFIHGGYWRAQRKEDAPVMAEAFNAAGAAVATLEYTLVPEATLGEVVREVRSAVAWLYRNVAAYGVDPERIYVSGSSAGGHLAGMLVAPGWPARYGVPDDVIKGTLALSGLFDLRPLCDVLPNTWLQLTPEQAAHQSPIFHLPERAGPMLLAVGGLETQGFKNQTAAYEAAWNAAGLASTRIPTPHCNHFDLVNELEDPDSDLTRATLAMMGLGAR
ncbi:alpha/beta hydrolase fold-3 domain protein [Achromobacter xylosoxidans A8]|uniref:Alpha/beta hydrolase fold-3 domain protein n=1 Tax=Achromobacter xylosoxidans (strain A8) TaxID=762376 RepID=E3HVF3_ACHXA|nr:alpha/beta hydrolase [Achromobacter xylosoxidans]ADP13818.1 alpha/beta hydrolase fold-3 domain protein [Achromobacter xylosoxidans A8]